MTEYSIDAEAAAAAVVAGTEWDVYDSATSRIKKVTGTQVATYVAGGALGTVNTTATTLTVTAALHANKTITVSSTAAIAVTLPAATGTGNTYRFQVNVAATATAHTISSSPGTDYFQGFVTALTTASANVIGYAATATDNTISLNGTTKGGVVGDWIEVVDVKSAVWLFRANTSPTGSTATPFSHV